MGFILACIAGVFVFYFIAFLLTGGSKVLSVIISIAAVCSIMGIGKISKEKIKTPEQRHIEKTIEDESNGILFFKADKDKKASFRFKMYKNGRLTEPSLVNGEFTYTITHVIYYKDEVEPRGFQLKVTRKSDGKTEIWNFHRKSSYYHTKFKDQVKLKESSDFETVKRIIQSARDNSAHKENSFCMHVLEK